MSTVPNPLSHPAFKANSPAHATFMAKMTDVRAKIAMMPEQPVSIINLNPYDLQVHHSLFAGLRVPTRQAGEPFAALVLRDVRLEVNTGTEGDWTPIEQWPIQLATEFRNQYSSKGGVFVIFGDIAADPGLQDTPLFKELYKKAENTLFAFAEQMKQQGDNYWNAADGKQKKNIMPINKLMGKFLYDSGRLTAAPAWVKDDVLAAADVLPECPSCRTRVHKEAVKCTCNYILSPVGAYKAGLIDEENIALERLTRAEAKELGISDFVAETSDERPDRVAAGRRKPLSRFVLGQEVEKENREAEARKAKG